ncbi:unnamed protein product [Macrosiphum euphorbiae]|uniref:Uncharacterized protein n=1 Tax=Macrosiphum euphorbiae TaxID=13131 RepID=A0AAV0X7A6_9HEMI|nr:unnamed protein product [Macrosiphum euphorbiae]
MPDVSKCQSLMSRSRNGVNIYATPLRTSYSFGSQPPRTASVQSSKYYLSTADVILRSIFGRDSPKVFMQCQRRGRSKPKITNKSF